MKPFNLEEYRANPSRKVITRDGRNARILCTDRKDGKYPIIALLEVLDDVEKIQSFTKNGYCDIYSKGHIDDIFFAPEKHEGWINMYKTNCVGTEVFNTPDSAKEYGMRHVNYVATIKIEWEE